MWEKSSICVIAIVIFCFVLLVGLEVSLIAKVERQEETIQELESQNTEYHQEIEWLKSENADLKAQVYGIYNHPENYTVPELLSLDVIKEFDEQYRKELDADEGIGDYIIVDTKDLSEAFLTHRADNPDAPIVIERAFGIVTTDELDGRIIDTGNIGNYISYRGVEGAQKGDFIVTYMMYEKNNYIDTIEVREDFILDLSDYCHETTESEG